MYEKIDTSAAGTWARDCELIYLTQYKGLKISYHRDEDDTEGRVAEVSDPYGYKIRRTYDERSRLKSCTDADGGFEYDYNERDQIIKVSCPVGCMSYDYDEIGNLIRIKDGNGNETRLEYDENYNLSAVIDAEEGITRYGYNDFHCLTQITLSNGSSKEIVQVEIHGIVLNGEFRYGTFFVPKG